jgi:hypothetical protein
MTVDGDKVPEALRAKRQHIEEQDRPVLLWVLRDALEDDAP